MTTCIKRPGHQVPVFFVRVVELPRVEIWDWQHESVGGFVSNPVPAHAHSTPAPSGVEQAVKLISSFLRARCQE